MLRPIRVFTSGLRGQLPDHEQLGAAGQPLHRQDRRGQVRVHSPDSVRRLQYSTGFPLRVIRGHAPRWHELAGSN